jgi:hypothetical protein
LLVPFLAALGFFLMVGLKVAEIVFRFALYGFIFLCVIAMFFN